MNSCGQKQVIFCQDKKSVLLLLVKMEHKNDKNELHFNSAACLNLQKRFLLPCYNERDPIF